MTDTFKLTGRLLDDALQPVPGCALTLTADPVLVTDADAGETIVRPPTLVTNTDGYLSRSVNGQPVDPPGVDLIVGPQYTIRSVVINGARILPGRTFDSPAPGATVDLSSLLPAGAQPPTIDTFVISVAGQTGVVTTGQLAAVLTPAAIGADPAGTATTAQAAAIAAAAGDATTRVGVETARAEAVEAVKADLVAGLVPTSQLPALALVTVVPVADQTARLALTTSQVQPGDVAVEASTGKTWMLRATDPTVNGNWTELPAVGKVQSVNGQQGVIVLAKADVGLSAVDNTADTAKPVSTATQTALNAKQAIATLQADVAAFVGTNSTLDTALRLLYATEKISTVAASTATPTLAALSTATIYDVTLTATCTITFPTAAAGVSFTLALTQDATGGRTVTWPGTVKWPQAVAPVLSTGVTKKDVLTFTCIDGTNWLGFLAALDMR